MAGYQFAHVNAYSSTRPAVRARNGKHTGTGERRWSASDVLDEATRAASAIPHIVEPIEPTWHVGSRAEIEQAGEEWAAGTRYASGRRARSDAPWLAAAVVSMPRESIEDWPDYRDQVVTWFQRRYGDRVRGVVEHLDEAHPHVHLYLVPRPGEEFGAVHEGYAAKTAARRAGETKVSTAYMGAMSRWQDELHKGVSWMHALTRTGPKRDRLTRDEWKQEQARVEAKARLDAIEAKAHQAHGKLHDAQTKLELAVDQAEVHRHTGRLSLEVAKRSADRLVELAQDDARNLLAQADLLAREKVATETKRIRGKGAEHFTAARTKLRDERATVRAEIRTERGVLEVEKQRLERVRTGLEGAYDVLKGSPAYQQLLLQREGLQQAKEAIAAGDLARARLMVEKTVQLDPVPQLITPTRSKPKPS